MHNWKHSQDAALKKALYRSIHLCRTNPDYRMRYPSEAKANPKGLVLLEPHPEAVKRITHDYMVRIRNAFQPAVERPKRLNKIG